MSKEETPTEAVHTHKPAAHKQKCFPLAIDSKWIHERLTARRGVGCDASARGGVVVRSPPAPTCLARPRGFGFEASAERYCPRPNLPPFQRLSSNPASQIARVAEPPFIRLEPAIASGPTTGSNTACTQEPRPAAPFSACTISRKQLPLRSPAIGAVRARGHDCHRVVNPLVSHMFLICFTFVFHLSLICLMSAHPGPRLKPSGNPRSRSDGPSAIDSARADTPGPPAQPPRQLRAPARCWLTTSLLRPLALRPDSVSHYVAEEPGNLEKHE